MRRFFQTFFLFFLMIQPARAQGGGEVDQGAFGLGTLSPGTGAMSRDLWEGASSATVRDLFWGVPTNFSDPLALEVLRRVTLSPGNAPAGADNNLAGQKFLTAARAGYYRDAASLASLIPAVRTVPSLAQTAAYAALMDGEVDAACRRGAGLTAGRSDPFWIKLRLICYARAGETAAADLTLTLLRRQEAVADTTVELYASFAQGTGPAATHVPRDVFEYVMMRERGVPFSPAAVRRLPIGMQAAIARDRAQSDATREAALVPALAAMVIAPGEGLELLDTMPTAVLTGEVLAVLTQPDGTLEHLEALGRALAAAGGDADVFKARASLLAQDLAAAKPIENYAPMGGMLAIAAVMTGQADVAERWFIALSRDQTSNASMMKAIELLRAYAYLDPGAARRIGSYLGVDLHTPVLTPMSVAPAAGADLPLQSFVSAALKAAQAGGEGPASLVYLMGAAVPMGATGSVDAGVRREIMQWARDAADLEWLDREIAFRQTAMASLTGETPAPQVRRGDGQAVPRLKPRRN